MNEFIEACFRGPVLPATILLLLSCAYWIFVIVGAVDLDGFDLDFDIDGDSVISIGFVPLRFLNLDRVPLMLWVSAFSLSFWVLSMLIDHDTVLESRWDMLQVLARNGGISLLLAKGLTQPFRGKFDAPEPNRVENLLGKTCTINTSEATPDFGQALFETGEAPLLLNVKTYGERLVKGDVVELIDFDPQERIYFVRRANQE